MFGKIKKHIINSFSQKEKDYYTDKVLLEIKYKNLVVYPALEIITKDNHNAIIVATNTMPLKHIDPLKTYTPTKPIAISYKDIDENGKLPNFIELSESEYRKLFFKHSNQ